MSIASYVINFSDLVKKLSIKAEDIQIDTKNIEAILNKYFPQLLDILKKLGDVEDADGTAKIKGLSSTNAPMRFTTDKDILLTGFTVSQSIFDQNCMDKWDIWIECNFEKINIINDMYSKDALQHKYFGKFYPVPMGYTVVIRPTNTGAPKVYWADIEYLEIG